jgi:hypothetical protein
MTILKLKQAKGQALESNIAIHLTQQDVSQHNYQSSTRLLYSLTTPKSELCFEGFLEQERLSISIVAVI